MEVKEGTPFLYTGIGISGKICSGKTTLAEHIESSLGFPRVSLANELKEQVESSLRFYGLDVRKGQLLGKYKEKVRPLLQHWGTLFRFFNGEDFWVETLFHANEKPFVVDDVRYENEVDGLRKRGFLLVHLSVYEPIRLARIQRIYPNTKEEDLRHASEMDLDGKDSLFDINIQQMNDNKESLFLHFDSLIKGKEFIDMPLVQQQFRDYDMPEVS